jgi:hypothetical protein
MCQRLMDQRQYLVLHNHRDDKEGIQKVDQLITMYCHCGDEAPEDPNEIRYSSK